MRKNQCKESLDIYIKFLERTAKLAQFLKVAEVRKSISIQGFSVVFCISLGAGVTRPPLPPLHKHTEIVSILNYFVNSKTIH